MTKKTKLELTWIGKDKRPKLEPRILLEDTEKSYHASQRFSEDDIFDNRLIFGDNLLALKAFALVFTLNLTSFFSIVLGLIITTLLEFTSPKTPGLS